MVFSRNNIAQRQVEKVLLVVEKGRRSSLGGIFVVKGRNIIRKTEKEKKNQGHVLKDGDLEASAFRGLSNLEPQLGYLLRKSPLYAAFALPE